MYTSFRPGKNSGLADFESNIQKVPSVIQMLMCLSMPSAMLYLVLPTCVISIAGAGYAIGNIDATLCLEAPKINPHIPRMQAILAEVMHIPESDISIKATTNETLGYVGTEQGVNAYAVALIERVAG
jgi:2-C-methyl-D-erythritol 2,4-cyclodiphosphate synthase